MSWGLSNCLERTHADDAQRHFSLAGLPVRLRFMERELKDRLGCGCPYCGVAMGLREYRPSRDHMLPRSRGGQLNHRNKAIVCQPCNWDKADLTLPEFHRELVKRGDPRASHVGRLIAGMELFLAGRFRIPQVSKEVRDTYPRLQGQLSRDLVHDLNRKIGCGCPYCGVAMGQRTFRPTQDLLIPRSRGGAARMDNKAVVCELCHDSKGDLTIDEFYCALSEDGDPRAFYVGRLIRSMRAFLEGRLSIPLVSREKRMTYPSVAYSLEPSLPGDDYEFPSLVPQGDLEQERAPAFGM